MVTDVVVVGYITADLIVKSPVSLIDSADVTLADIELRPGGSGVNLAGWLHYLDVPVALYAFAGNDNLGAIMLSVSEDACLWMNITRLGATPTIVSLPDVDGNRRMLVDRGGPFDSADLPIPRDHVGWLHVPAFMLYRPDLYSAALLTLRTFAPHCSISLDVNSFTFLANFGVGRLVDLIKEIEPEVVAMNEAESRLIPDIDSLAKHVRHIIVHRGRNPSLLWQDGFVVEIDTGIELDNQIVDSTGAGDALLAGFIAGILRGSSATEALVHGHRVAQVAIGQIGGFPFPQV
jgi:sugar/nucleoside kinase (ribokinase family)